MPFVTYLLPLDIKQGIFGMRKIYNVIPNNFGYILTDGNEKFVLYNSKKSSGAPHYLKRVTPSEKYLSGMFYDKRTNQFRGKTLQNEKIVVKFYETRAVIELS